MHVDTFSNRDDRQGSLISTLFLQWSWSGLQNPFQLSSVSYDRLVQISAILKMDFFSHANSRSQIPVTGQEYLIGVGCTEVKVGERLPRMLKSYAPGTPMDMKCSLLWITILGVKVTEPNLTPSLNTYLDPQGALLGQQHLFWRGPGAWSVGLQVVLEMSGLEVLRREEQRCLMQVSLLLETDRAERDTEQLLRNSEIQLYSVSYSVPRICEHKKRNFSPLLINYYNKLQKTHTHTHKKTRILAMDRILGLGDWCNGGPTKWNLFCSFTHLILSGLLIS